MKNFNPELFILDLYYAMDMDNVVLVPSIDGFLTDYELEDAGRIIRMELFWDRDQCISEAREFGRLVNRLFDNEDPDEICSEYCSSGSAPELLSIMIRKFAGFISLDAPEEVLRLTCEQLARIFVINRISARTECIDMLMDERVGRSLFPKRPDLTLDDFRKIAVYLKKTDNILTSKAVIFHEMSVTDSDVEQLYKDVLNS